MIYNDFTTTSEHALLREITRDNYSGAGSILDAGCFIGASTLSLCEGISKSLFKEHLRLNRKTVIAIDRFLAMDNYVIESLRASGRDIRFGECFLDEFLQRLAAYIYHLEVRAGDLFQVGRLDTPLEILFIDIAKTAGLNNFVLKSWFPHILPNGIIIQQDFYSPAQPWVAASMGLALDYLDIVGVRVSETATFRLRKPITLGALQSISDQCTDPVMALYAFDKLLERVDERGHYPLLLMKALALADLGLYRKAVSSLEDAYVALGPHNEEKACNWFALVEGVVRPSDVKQMMRSSGTLKRHIPRSRQAAVRAADEC